MCGIIGYAGRRPARELILGGLARLEYRGYDSAGVALVGADGVEITRAVGQLANLEVAVGPSDATLGIGHTRWATHGGITEENAHPFRSCDGSLALVLNGIVENHGPLRAELSRRGHEFRSETDAEVVVHLLEEHGGDLVAAVEAVVRRLEGQCAFVVASAREPDRVVGFRRGCPLVVGHGDGETFLASMALGFADEAETLTALHDGEIAVITPEGAEIRRGGVRIERTPEPVQGGRHEHTKDGFPTFMLKEFFEQADALERLLHTYVAPDGSAPQIDLGLDPLRVAGLERILILGCGTSYHAALAASFAFEAWTGIRTEAAVASEWRYGARLLSPYRTLVIAVSQSGETADTLGALEAARATGAPALAITNIAGTQITRDADRVLFTQCGLELGVAATKTFSSQLVLLLMLALQLAAQRGRVAGPHLASLTHELLCLPDAVDCFFTGEHPIRELAERHRDARFLFFLGRRSGYAACLEGALKVKELAYIPVEVHAAGEMKHGPIALLDEGTPVVCVATDRDLRDKLSSNIAEVRARGASVIAIAGDRDEEMQHLVEDVIYVPEADPLISPILAVLPLQLLAYELASGLGYDVDRPRNLAKTVTVE